MREIKFEVYDNFNKYICVPFLFEKSNESDRISEDARFDTPYIYYATPNDYLDGIRRPCFVREFTGLQDITGKDIYEGDVYSWHSFDATYDDNLKQIQARPIKINVVPDILSDDFDRIRNLFNQIKHRVMTNKITVIGNIYENPELIAQ